MKFYIKEANTSFMNLNTKIKYNHEYLKKNKIISKIKNFKYKLN
jgi:hypothetical protein